MSIGNYAQHAAIWDWYAADRSEEAAFWTVLAKRYGTKVIAAMCATGTVAAALAESGLQVTGVDITKEMIEAARHRYVDRRNLLFVQADLCALQLPDQEYDLAFVGTSSFHHLQTTEQRKAALSSLHRHTREGGALALELWSPAGRSWSSSERRFDPINPPADSQLRVWKTGKTEYDDASQRVTITQEVFIERGGQVESFPHAFSLQLFDRGTLEEELNEVGYSMVAEYGSHGFAPWAPSSPKWVIEAIRR